MKIRGIKMLYLTHINHKKLLWLCNSQGKQFKVGNIYQVKRVIVKWFFKNPLGRYNKKKGMEIHFPVTYECIILKKLHTRLVLLEQTSPYSLTSLLESLEHISPTKPTSIDFFLAHFYLPLRSYIVYPILS